MAALAISAGGELRSVIKSEAFDSLSQQLVEAVKDQREIRDRALHEFTRLTILMIYHGEADAVPEAFSKMKDLLDEYWHFETPDDKESRKVRSYARLYQIIETVSIYKQERIEEISVKLACQENKKHQSLLDLIYNNPGIRHGKLSDDLGITSAALSQKIKELELSGYVDHIRSGKYKYYTLTPKGIKLYRELTGKQLEPGLLEHWSIGRLNVIIKALNNILTLCRYNDIYDISITSFTSFGHQLLRMSESQLDRFIQRTDRFIREDGQNQWDYKSELLVFSDRDEETKTGDQTSSFVVNVPARKMNVRLKEVDNNYASY